MLWVNATGVMRPKRERERGEKKKLMEAEKERENGVDDQLSTNSLGLTRDGERVWGRNGGMFRA